MLQLKQAFLIQVKQWSLRLIFVKFETTYYKIVLRKPSQWICYIILMLELFVVKWLAERSVTNI